MTASHLLALVLALSATIARADFPTATREQLNAVLWMQTATEYRAAVLQTYRTAAHRLELLKRLPGTASVEQAASGEFAWKAPAVVMDVDETVLDNSAFGAGLVRDGRAFDPASWEAWVHARQAKALPGAAAFVHRARVLGYQVIYITNRNCNRAGGYDSEGRALDCPQKAATLDDLERVLGYRPGESDLHMRFEVAARDDSDKRARRELVAQRYRIVMLVGDDLSDFIRRDDYSEETHSGLWGERWFALPNPVYGSWERAFPNLAAKYASLAAWNAPEPSARTKASLSLLSWNIAWLADPEALRSARFWEQCAVRGWPNEKLRPDLPFCNAYVRGDIRSAADYEAKKLAAVRRTLAEHAARGVDVLAVQEVQGPAALQTVLPEGFRVACFTTRDDAQNLGYALRISAQLNASCREIGELSLEDDASAGRPVRRGLELSIEIAGETVTLLNVHLKSGCARGRMDRARSEPCPILQRQAEPLERWVEETARAGRPFLILGDWNRDLDEEVRRRYPARSDRADPSGPVDAARVRNLFPEVNDGVPAASRIELARVDRGAAAERACFAVLDHVVISSLLKARLDPGSLDADQLPARLIAAPPGASDHCPLATVLRFR